MLRMDQVYVIRHQVLVEGGSQQRVTKEFGISRLTVRSTSARRRRSGTKRGRGHGRWAAVHTRVETPPGPNRCGGRMASSGSTATRLHALLVAEGQAVGITVVMAAVAEWT